MKRIYYLFILLIVLILILNVWRLTTTPKDGTIDTGREICVEDGKPLVLLSGFLECGHARWLMNAIMPLLENYSNAGLISAHVWILNLSDGWFKPYVAKGIDIQTVNLSSLIRNASVGIWDDIMTPDIIEGNISRTYLDIIFEDSSRFQSPTLIMGCKYVLVGTRYEKENDPAKEIDEIKYYLDKLINRET